MNIQDLPQPFKDRIARFNRLFQAGTEDHHDFEHHLDNDGKPGLFRYEMFCIETALAFAELLSTKEALDTFLNECKKEYKENPPEKYKWESKKDYQKRIDRGPDLFDVVKRLREKNPNNLHYEEHSGNTMGASWFLFRTYITYPELVPYAHGCLAYLIGDKGYFDDRSDVPEMK